MAHHNQLVVSEIFYSIQGEGKFTGTPAVFLRLAGCNLRCRGFSYRHPQTGQHLGCDTQHVWSVGEKKSIADVIAHLHKHQYFDHLRQGAHLVVTGGEPTIQQRALVDLFAELDRCVGREAFIECETNATLALSDTFLARLNQINASPKLSSSGEAHAYQPTVLRTLVPLAKTSFKFVMTSPSDIDEIQEKFVQALGIAPHQIWLMPEGGTRTALDEKQAWVVELAKRYTMNYSTRLHVLIWDQATGV